MEFLRFAGFESSNVRIVVQTDDHALKQLLSFVPGHRQQVFVVPGKAADEIVDRRIGADGARVYVVEVDSFGNINLTAMINRFLGPARFVERGQAAPGVDKTFGDVVGLIATGETIHPQARLKPLNIREPVTHVFHGEPKIHLILARVNVVQNLDVRLDERPEPKSSAVLVRGNQLRAVRNGRLMPIAMRRAAAAKGFEIQSIHFAAGQIPAGNGEHVIAPGDRQPARRPQVRHRKNQ